MRPEYRTFFASCVTALGLPDGEFKMESTYCQIKTVMPGWKVHFEWHFAGRPFSCLEVGIHFERNPQSNRLCLASARIKENALRKATGKEVIVEESWGDEVQWSRMFVSQETTRDEIVNQELLAWAVETMTIFRQLVEPVLVELWQRDNRR